MIGRITLEVKCAGARSAGNPHAACDVAGAGDGATVGPTWARRGKPRIRTRVHPDGQPRQLSTLPHYCRTTRNGKFGLGRKPVGKRVDQTYGVSVPSCVGGCTITHMRWPMAREDSEWMAALLRRPDQFPIPQAVCISPPSNVAACLATPVANGPDQAGQAGEGRGGFLAAAANPASMARTAVCRQTPEVGAPCVSAHAGICTGGVGQPAFLPYNRVRGNGTARRYHRRQPSMGRTL